MYRSIIKDVYFSLFPHFYFLCTFSCHQKVKRFKLQASNWARVDFESRKARNGKTRKMGKSVEKSFVAWLKFKGPMSVHWPRCENCVNLIAYQNTFPRRRKLREWTKILLKSQRNRTKRNGSEKKQQVKWWLWTVFVFFLFVYFFHFYIIIIFIFFFAPFVLFLFCILLLLFCFVLFAYVLFA